MLLVCWLAPVSWSQGWTEGQLFETLGAFQVALKILSEPAHCQAEMQKGTGGGWVPVASELTG